MFQRKYLIFLTVLIMTALVWSGGWFWLADKLRSDIAGFVSARQDNGVVLNWSNMLISGFPFQFDINFENPQGQWAISNTQIAWIGANFSIHSFIKGRGTVSFNASGRHKFDIHGNGTDLSVHADTASFQGRLVFDSSGQALSLRARAAPLTARLNGGPEITISETNFDWRNDAGPTTRGTLSVVLEQVNLETLLVKMPVATNLGGTIQTVSGRATLLGPLDPATLDSANVSRWRDAGGTLEMESFNLVWGPLRIAGDGTLSVDSALQPVGAFSARIAGLHSLLDLLEARGQIPRPQAALARIGLAALIRRPANGGPAEAHLPVTLQNRVLSIGPIPLLTMDPVIWK